METPVHHRVTFLSKYGLSRYSCLHLGSLHPRIFVIKSFLTMIEWNYIKQECMFPLLQTCLNVSYVRGFLIKNICYSSTRKIIKLKIVSNVTYVVKSSKSRAIWGHIFRRFTIIQKFTSAEFVTRNSIQKLT